MTSMRVLGIGSPFGEDRAGWRVVDILKRQMLPKSYFHDYIQMDCYDRPGIRLIELMHNAKIVFLVDAVKSCGEIGTVYRFENQEIQNYTNMLSTHHMGVAQVLQLGAALNEIPDTIILFGIEINNVDLHASISEPVEKAIGQVVMQLKNEIMNKLHVDIC